MRDPNDEVLHGEMASSFRLLAPQTDPNLVILCIETKSGATHNFVMDRASFAHVVGVWHFDLTAMAGAIESGAPLPDSSKPVDAS